MAISPPPAGSTLPACPQQPRTRCRSRGRRLPTPFSREEPLALLIGFVLDQQVSVQKAFAGPCELRRRIGSLEARSIAAIDPAELAAAFTTRPALHRFPSDMARRVQELCVVVVERYGGDASRIWDEAADGPDLEARLLALPGIGAMKARSLIAVLARRFRLELPGLDEVMPHHPTLGDVDSPEALASYQAQKRAARRVSKALTGIDRRAACRSHDCGRAEWSGDFTGATSRCTVERGGKADRMVDPRSRRVRTSRSPKALARAGVLPQTADGSMGMSNLATVPRAGNISIRYPRRLSRAVGAASQRSMARIACHTITTHATSVGRVIPGASGGSGGRAQGCVEDLGGGARPARAECPTVEAHDGHELADRRRGEGLVGRRQLGERVPAFLGPRSPASPARRSTQARVTPARMPRSSAGVKRVIPRRHQTFVVGPSRTDPSAATKMASPAPRRSASSCAAMFTA